MLISENLRLEKCLLKIWYFYLTLQCQCREKDEEEGKPWSTELYSKYFILKEVIWFPFKGHHLYKSYLILKFTKITKENFNIAKHLYVFMNNTWLTTCNGRK